MRRHATAFTNKSAIARLIAQQIGHLLDYIPKIDINRCGRRFLSRYRTAIFVVLLYYGKAISQNRERKNLKHPKIAQQITFLYTPDLTATARFYENIIGLELVLDQGTCRIYATAPNSYLGFCERIPAADPKSIIFTLVTPDVDGWYGFLKEQGVVFEKPPAYNPQYQIYHCFLRDPNGYLIEIQRFEDPRWCQ